MDPEKGWNPLLEKSNLTWGSEDLYFIYVSLELNNLFKLIPDFHLQKLHLAVQTQKIVH